VASVEWFVALRYLKGTRKYGVIAWITYISAIGVCLGSFVLIVALSIANGFEKEVRQRIVGTLADAKILQYHSTPIANYDSLREVILKLPHVRGAAPYITGKGGIEHEKIQEGVFVTGIDQLLDTTVTDIGRSIKYGAFNLDMHQSERKRSFPGIILGVGLADKMGVREGAEVVLMSLTRVDGEDEPVPTMMRFTVAGIFETGMYEYDLTLVYISIASAQKLFNVKGVEGIQIKTDDIFKADEIASEVKEALGGYPFRAVDWKSQNRSLFQWMKLEKLIIFVVISLIMVVAAFNIVSSLLMMVIEKRREIGILMSMGASKTSILKIFMFNGILIGFLGSTVGTILGTIPCLIQAKYQLIPIPGDIYFIDKLPMLVEPIHVVLVYIAGNIICWSATIIPALLASKTLPAESMRYE
jgi:lipoprotein-releasing system permease protein